MAEPHRLPTGDTCDGDATRPTGEPDPAPTDVESPRPPIGDTEAGDATGLTGEPDRAPADAEPPSPAVGDTRDGDATRPTGEPDPAATDVEPPGPPVGDTRDGDAACPTAEPDRAPADVEASPDRSAAPKFDVQNIPIDDILVVGPRRAVDEEIVAQLVQSIKRIGLQTPITVRVPEKLTHPETGEVLTFAYGLITGRNRREACRRLGWPDIPAIVRDCTQHEAELWEIEENLARAELTPEQKTEQTIRLAAVIKEMAESLKDSDFPEQAGPTTGRGHKGTIQKLAERIGVNQGTVRHRMKNAEAAIGEAVDLDRDTPAKLRRKADAYKKATADHKAKPKPARDKQRETTQAPKPAHKDREKTQATKRARQQRLTAAIVDYNVAWPPDRFDAGMAELTAPEKADLRQHLPDVMNKHQQLADYIGLRSAAAVDEASCADQSSLFGNDS